MILAHRSNGLAGVDLQTGSGVTGDVPRHWHEEYHLCAITGGSGEINHRGTTYSNPPGSLNLVEPGELHSNHTGDARGCDFLKLDFDPELFRSVTRELPAFAAPTIYDAETFERYVRMFESLKQSATPLDRDVEFLGFLVLLLRRHTRQRLMLGEVKREPRSVQLVREYLTENYQQNVSLAQLSSLTGLSPFHLTRVFHKETGMPPHAFLKQVRVLRAKALLRRRVPISHVALETGFADQSHLTRTFKHIVRVSPGAYRRSGQ